MPEKDEILETTTSLIDDAKAYFSEKLDSPIITTFLVSWVVINSDFVLYWIFGKSEGKFQMLSNWDFSGFFLNSIYSHYTNSILNPLISALLATLTFSFFSYSISGLRHKLAGYAKGFAVKNKANLDMVEKAIQEETKFQKLKKMNANLIEENEILNNQNDALNKEKQILTKDIEDNRKFLESSKESKVTSMLVDSLYYYGKYSEDKSKFNLIPAEKVSGKSILSFTITGNNYIKDYDDIPIKDLILISDICAYDKYESLSILHAILFERIHGRLAVFGQREFELRKILNIEDATPF